jgi:hypothetical protein
MNPYFEQADVWSGFHNRFIIALADDLAAQIDPRYITDIEERLYLRELPEESPRFLGRSDVSVKQTNDGGAMHAGVGVLEAPAHVRLPEVDFERMRYIDIRGMQDRRIVTTIEVLSPTNKYSGPDREQYLRKRAEILHSRIHFVEIDLLRGGPRMPMDNLQSCDYCVLVSRAAKRPDAGVWPISLREPLPKIPVPLREPDPDAQIDLQTLLHRVHDAARYKTYIYQGSPYPQLSGEDAKWAEGLIRPVSSA